MLLTKEQISEQMCKHAQKKNGLHDLMEIIIESMMIAERSEFLVENPGNKGNGYHPHLKKSYYPIPKTSIRKKITFNKEWNLTILK